MARNVARTSAVSRDSGVVFLRGILFAVLFDLPQCLGQLTGMRANVQRVQVQSKRAHFPDQRIDQTSRQAKTFFFRQTFPH